MPSHLLSGCQPGAGTRPRAWLLAERRGSAPTTLCATSPRSATTRFCAGATKPSPAAIASSTLRARMIPIMACTEVSAGSRAVHERAATWPGGTMDAMSWLEPGRTGPFPLHRSVTVTGSAPLTAMTDRRDSSRFHPSGVRTSSGSSGFNLSRKRSWSSAWAWARPQARRPDRPVRTAGMPGTVPPITLPVASSSRARCQTDGAANSICRSLARRAPPAAVRSGAAAHAFDAPSVPGHMTGEGRVPGAGAGTCRAAGVPKCVAKPEAPVGPSSAVLERRSCRRASGSRPASCARSTSSRRCPESRHAMSFPMAIESAGCQGGTSEPNSKNSGAPRPRAPLPATASQALTPPAYASSARRV